MPVPLQQEFDLEGPSITSSPSFALPLPKLSKGKGKKHQSSKADAFATPPRSRASSLSAVRQQDSRQFHSTLPVARSGEENTGPELSSSPVTSDTAYYTALWGSPYDFLSNTKVPRVGHRRHNSDIVADGSPLVSKSARGIQPPRSAGFATRDESGSIFPVDEEVTSLKKPTYDLTGDWIREYHRVQAERKTWLSDGSDNSDGNSANSGEGEDWPEFNLPTPRAIVKGRPDVLNASDSPIQSATSKHKHLPSDATLTQEDFNDIQIESSGRQSRASKMLSALMSGGIPRRERNTGSISEKPLPAAPLNRTVSEFSARGDQPSKPLPSHRQQPSAAGTNSFVRPKKKVIWKGKTCTIALPLEDVKDEFGQPKTPLRSDEVTARLARWEQMGKSIRGFDITEFSPGDSLTGQSCDVYPDLSEYQDAIKSRRFAVRIPNKQLWDDYVKQLQEEKLRALGVTLVDEEPPPRSQSVLTQLSRQASSHSPLPQALPGLPLSANSFRSSMDQVISPAGSVPNSQFPFPLAMVSPNIQPVMPRSAGFHMVNQSVPFNRERVFSPNSLSSHPASSSGQQYLGSTPSSRGISPLVDERKQSIWSTQSMMSPVPDVLQNGFAQGQFNLQPHLSQHGHLSPNFDLEAPNSYQQQAHNNLHKQIPAQYVSQPEIASPLPQGRSHRHNVSESLQKEIDEAEYHLETSNAQQIEDTDRATHSAVGSRANNFSAQDSSIETITGQVPKKSMSIVSDIETNPSQTTSPRLSTSKLAPSIDHGRKVSVSKLNVNAQEFVFNPTKSSFSPMFTFGDKSPGLPHSATSTGFEGAHSKNASNTSSFGPGLNVAAPAFVPGKPVEPTTNRVFSFASTVPVLKPDAPAFTPGLVFGEIPGGVMDKRPIAARVFNYGEMIELPKKSKAVSIAQPEIEDDEQEDEEGRITQGEGRQKRARREGGSGDQIPLFATPHDDMLTMPPLHSNPADAEDVSRNVRVSQTEEKPDPEEKAEQKLENEPREPAETTQVPEEEDSVEVDEIARSPKELQATEPSSEIVRSADVAAEGTQKADAAQQASDAPIEAPAIDEQPARDDNKESLVNPDYTIADVADNNLDMPQVHEEPANEEEESNAAKMESGNNKSSGLVPPSPLQQIPISLLHDTDTALNTADFLEAPSTLASPLLDKTAETIQASHNDSTEPTAPLESDRIARSTGVIDDPFTVGDHEDGNHTDKSTAGDKLMPQEIRAVERQNSSESVIQTKLNSGRITPSDTPSEMKKTTLSAKAKPFIFNPAVSVFNPEPTLQHSVTPTKLGTPDVPEFQISAGQSILKSQTGVPSPEHAPSHPAMNLATIIAQEAIPKKPAFSGGLGASRYATEEPQPIPIKLSPAAKTSPSPPAKAQEPIQARQPSSSLEQSTTSIDETRRRVSSPELSSFASGGGNSVSERQYSRPVTPTQVPIAERIASGVHYVEPSFKEIDDVMKQLNGDDSDLGVERNPEQVWKSPRASGRDNMIVPDRVATPISERLRASPSRIPTSSPNHLDRPFQYLPDQDYGSSNSEDSRRRDAAAEMVARNARYSPSFKKPHHMDNLEEERSSVHRLNRKISGSISNWDDIVSDNGEADFHGRVGFFGNRVEQVIVDVLDDRLQPIESTVAELTTALTKMKDRSRSSRPRRSRSVESDADDEDDETGAMRAVSPFMKDRRFEKLRSVLLDAVTQHRASDDGMKQLLENVADLKAELSKHGQSRDPNVENDKVTVSKLADAITEIKSTLASKVSSTPSEDSLKMIEAISELKSMLGDQKTAPKFEETPSALPVNSLANLTSTIVGLQASLVAHQRSQSQNIKTVIEDAINKQMREKSTVFESGQDSTTQEKVQLEIRGLENMLKKAEERAEEEYKLRRTVEDRLAEAERERQAAIAEANQQRNAAEAAEARLRSSLLDRQQFKEQAAMLEEVKITLENDLSDVQDKNAALEETIAEYRVSHDDWRNDIDAANAENEQLARTVSTLREELEDGILSRQALGEKFERIQKETIAVTQSIARDQASWRHKDEEHKAKHDLSNARLEAEARTRERLELEIERLEKQEREAMKARTLVEDIRSQNGNLTNMVNELRSKAHHFQERSMTLERELYDAKERSRLEIQRIIGVTKNDIDGANQQAQTVRTNLEGVIQRLEDQVSHLQIDAKGPKERYQAMLEEASVSKNNALREAAEAREAALQEHYRFHERTIRETQVSHERAMNELKADHSRAFANAHEDHQRAVSNLMEDYKLGLGTAVQEKRIAEQEFDGRLALSTDQISHLQEKVKHLEERLSIANSAAQAAAEAARTARSSSSLSPNGRTIAPSLRGFDPQALRQTVETLQDQLGERERQIERLQQDLDEVDREAPNKVKERDVEITWLRELLGVRLDDLQDIIVQLSTPRFNRIAVRDAVIRLQANLQMEQQERERQQAGGVVFPSLSDIRASPKALPLAAAAAWGSWRKGQSSLSSLAEMAVPSRSSSANQTPSKSSPQSFLSGLLTPPSTNVRQTPRGRGSLSRPTSSSQRPPASFSTPKRQISVDYNTQRQNEIAEVIPETPALLTQAAYDADAPEGPHHYSLDQYASEEADLPSEDNSQQGDNDSSTITTSENKDTAANPFGPSIELAG